VNKFDRLKKRVTKRVKKIFQNNAQPVSKAVGKLARDIADETVGDLLDYAAGYVMNITLTVNDWTDCAVPV